MGVQPWVFGSRLAGVEPALTRPKRAVLPLNYNLSCDNLALIPGLLMPGIAYARALRVTLPKFGGAPHWTRTSNLSFEDSCFVH